MSKNTENSKAKKKKKIPTNRFHINPKNVYSFFIIPSISFCKNCSIVRI